MRNLPGSYRTIKESENISCEDCDKLATVKVQGETDSFGCEYIYLCKECHEKIKLAEKKDNEGEKNCDWCKERKINVKPFRDLDEGNYGRVYSVCNECIKIHINSYNT